MLRHDKERIVSELAERLKSSQNLLVADYRGLTMPEIDELRSKLLETGARFSVVKNTLTRLAAEQAGIKELLELIDGPTAIAFLDAEADPATAAKILNDTARAHDVLVIRGGLLEGDAVTDVEIQRLATLPPADVLRAQLAGAVLEQLCAQLVDLRHRQPAVVGDEQRLSRAQPLGQLRDQAFFVIFLHLLTSSNDSSPHTGRLAEGGGTSLTDPPREDLCAGAPLPVFCVGPCDEAGTAV